MITGATIRPNTKTVWLAYGLASLLLIAGFWLYYEYGQNQPAWLMAISLIAFLPPLKMQLQRLLRAKAGIMQEMIAVPYSGAPIRHLRI